MMKVIAYKLSSDFEDYNSQWVKIADMDKVCCQNKDCQRLLDNNYFNDDFVFKKKKSDIYFINCGGIYLVSKKFQQFVRNNDYNGIDFIQLPKSNDFAILDIHNLINVDSSQIDESPECPYCGNNIHTSMSIGYKDYESKKVIRLLDQQNDIADGFFKTNIKLGAHVNFAPLIIVGVKTKTKIKESGLVGMYFRAIIPSKAEI